MYSLAVGIIILLAVLTIWAFVAVFGRIVSRAGYSRWWLVLMVVPLVNLIMLWVFAFADWPVAKPRGQA
jgi:hypothetical protein